ncbi:hypothetical protein T08_1087 [Trichinella sp. T8]|nr:hypothetical protein T08_7647 [Trichinella sp. T8]KRZ88704.1 hypothetical protein T08_1087 [Trichinella sp. T8]
MLSSCIKGNTHTHIIFHFSIIPQFEPKFPIIGQNRILDFINNEKSPSTTLVKKRTPLSKSKIS